MKTAISVPDDTFRRATQRAAELGISRSELFTEAVKRYLDELDGPTLTAQIDEAAGAINADETTREVVLTSRALLARDDEGW